MQIVHATACSRHFFAGSLKNSNFKQIRKKARTKFLCNMENASQNSHASAKFLQNCDTK